MNDEKEIYYAKDGWLMMMLMLVQMLLLFLWCLLHDVLMMTFSFLSVACLIDR
jgi:hypothetical protein